MEVRKINVDMLEGESNTELINQEKGSGSMDQSTLQNEDQKEIESRYKKEETKLKSDENVDSSSYNDLQMHNENFQTSLLHQKTLSVNTSSDILFDREQIEEPFKKKLKLDDEDRVLPSLSEGPISYQSGQNPELQTEHEQQSDLEADMLATLASEGLEQDPKNETHQGTPESPSVKQESEIAEKKPELWHTVGVFDTNSATVSEYMATPEPNEHVDLVTATLAGHKIQLEPGTAYKLRVCAVNSCGTSSWSDVVAFRTTIPGYPGAPFAIKIFKTPEGAYLTWQPPDGDSSDILEYAVYLAVRSESQESRRVTTNQGQLAFVRVFCGPTNRCMVGINTLNAAYIDTTTKPAIIFRIAAKNAKGYGPATQVKWLQESKNGGARGPKMPSSKN